MSMKKHRLLLVDDDPISLKIMSEWLTQAGFICTIAKSACQASSFLEKEPFGFFSAILLDNQMPGKTGFEFLKEIKQGSYTHLPVIMQTGNDDLNEVRQCIAAGAFYYLTKPLNKKLLISVVDSAINDLENHLAVRSEMSKIDQSLDLLNQALFQYKTPRDATVLSAFLARLGSSPDKLSMGLYELLINSIEHGNLGISYDEKTDLIEGNRLQEEITSRLNDEKYKHRIAEVSFSRSAEKLIFTIEDQGQGFDFEEYMEFSIDRALDSHGRGIMMANKLSFDSLEYSKNGRRVTATCFINSDQK